MADVNTDIEAALEAAASKETADASSKSEETEEAVVEATEGKTESEAPKGKGAQNRIQEILASSKGLEKQIEELTGTVGSRDEEIGKLVDLLELRDNDAKVVAKINELHQMNPDFKELIETLDSAIRGEEVTVKGDEKDEGGEKTGEAEAVAKAQELLRSAQTEMDDALAGQRDDLILHKADILTDRYVAELPKEYNEEDINILRTVLVDHIDWDAIEENPDALNEIFANGFQSALNWYQTPKGATPAVSSEDDEGDEKTNNEPVTQERLDAYTAQDWGKLKMVETPDGKEVKPEISDEDFTQSLAAAMKKQNALNAR